MKKIILLSMAVTTMFVSCQKSEEQTTELSGASEVVFTSAISTRATGTQWDSGDEIGVFMYYTDLTEVLDSNNENVLYTTLGGESATFSSSDPLIYPEYGTTVDFLAYHPYTTNFSNYKVTLNTADQSSESKVKEQDFMVASAQSCNENNAPSLSFLRKMSKISVTIIRKDSKADAVISNISLTDVITDGSFAITNAPSCRENSSVAVGETTSNISLFESESNQIEAIIVPQTTTSSTLKLTLDGEIYPMALFGTFAENTHYNYTLTVGTNKVELSGATIIGWDDDSESVDLSQNKETFTASEITADNIPTSDVWVITDEGEITSELMLGVRNALKEVSSAERKISIVMPNATSIGEEVFYDENAYPLVSLELPNVTSIGNYAFYKQLNLTVVNMPKIETIGEAAFRDCSNLVTISDLSGVTSIGRSAFSNCTALATDIKLLQITELPSYVFRFCQALKSVEMPKVEIIGMNAFEHCYNLAAISDLSGVTSIGEYAFSNCTALATDIKLNQVTELPFCAFYLCQNLKSVEIANVTTIGGISLFGCTSLVSVVMPKVETIGESAFCYCSNLAAISDLSNVTSIGTSAFENCTALTDIKLPQITELPSFVFYLCQNLKSVEIPNIEIIGGYAFSNCYNLVTISDLSNVTSIEFQAFGYCYNLEIDNLYLPNITTLPEGVFYRCEKIKSINMPNVESIGTYALNGLQSLTEIELPKATTVGENAFNNCQNLKSISLPAATTIASYAFCETNALTTLKLTSEEVITCGEYIFANLEDMNYNPSEVTLYINSINNNVKNLTDGTYSFKEVILMINANND